MPPSDFVSWARPVCPVSPAPAYSILSGPNAIRPPLWMYPLGMPLKIVSGEPNCSPDGLLSSYSMRTMRLSDTVVKYA